MPMNQQADMMGNLPPEMLQLLEVLMQIMSEAPPGQIPGEVPRGLPAAGVPQQVMDHDPLEEILMAAVQRVQQQNDFGSGQQLLNGAQGGQGAMFGGMGGRPRGS